MRHIKCWSEFDLLYFGFPTWDLYIYVCNHLSKYFLTPASPNNNVIDSAGCLGGGLIMPRTASRCWSTGLQKSIHKLANCKKIACFCKIWNYWNICKDLLVKSFYLDCYFYPRLLSPPSFRILVALLGCIAMKFFLPVSNNNRNFLWEKKVKSCF